jgi:ADP-dependent NAD(P)H-hydrate dehydratase / NAD(P)H-hydrate epimerase
MWIANAEHSRIIDRRATEEFGIPSRVLMEHAGHAVFDAVRELLPDGGRITVFCGKGHNGGDGFVVARLAKDHGYDVDCLVAAAESELSDLTRAQMEIGRRQGISPVFAGEPRWTRKTGCLGARNLVVDALLGIGAKCEVKGPVREAIQAINRSGVPAVAIDVPSGIACDTGEELGESVWALRTVTFALPKPFLFQGIGLEHAGYWTVADIGMPGSLLEEPTDAKLVECELVGNLLPERLRASHKGENGSVLIVAGSRGMPGAASLVARAALRAGAGLVTVASVASTCQAVAAQIPEVLCIPLPDEDGVLGPEAARQLESRLEKYHSAVFGPGLTHEDPVLEFLRLLWSSWEKPCVVDADALNAVSRGLTLPKAECVLTPHPGEMSRLLRSSIAEIQADRFETVRQAVAKFRQCALLKGPYTIVGEPDQPMMVNCTGNPGLASGGMGDVLSGVVGSLLAQDLPPYYAASCGMYWHGAAADHCADTIGCVGYTASDVANALPQARGRIISDCKACSYDTPG